MLSCLGATSPLQPSQFIATTVRLYTVMEAINVTGADWSWLYLEFRNRNLMSMPAPDSEPDPELMTWWKRLVDPLRVGSGAGSGGFVGLPVGAGAGATADAGAGAGAGVGAGGAAVDTSGGDDDDDDDDDGGGGNRTVSGSSSATTASAESGAGSAFSSDRSVWRWVLNPQYDEVQLGLRRQRVESAGFDLFVSFLSSGPLPVSERDLDLELMVRATSVAPL